MTRLWGPTLPSVHPSLPRSLPSHCTLFFPPFFFCFCLLPSVFPFPLFFTISPFSSSLFLSHPFPLAPCLSPCSAFPRFTSTVCPFLPCSPELIFPILQWCAFFRSFISPYLLPFFFSFFTLCFFKSSNIQQQLCFFSTFPQTFPTCLYSSFPHIDILSQDPPRVFPRHATCPRASLVQVAAVAPRAVSD